MRWLTGILCAVLLSGCQTMAPETAEPPVVDPYQLHMRAGGFELALMTPPRPSGPVSRIYIEADFKVGPQGMLMAQKGLGYLLFSNDPGSYYVRFPCFEQSPSGCDSRYLTSHRYATEQSEAVARILEEFKRIHDVKRLEVVAIGDAAPLMLKVAALGGEIDHLHTIDGMLSPAIWARQKGMTPPASSDPLIYFRQLSRQAQTHWISSGSGPLQEHMAGRYKAVLKQSGCVRLRIASTVKRDADWLKVWPRLRNDRFRCS